MPSLFIDKKSPFYWIRVYDRKEADPKKRRKKYNTKIRVTEADRERHASGGKIYGTKETADLLKRTTAAMVHKQIEDELEIDLAPRLPLDRGLKVFLEAHAIPGDPDSFKPKTVEGYKITMDHFLEANFDQLYIHECTEEHFNNFLRHLHKKGRSQNTLAIYSRNLRTLWNYFIKKGYTDKNIIRNVRGAKANPSPIPIPDVEIILDKLKEKEECPHHYQFAKFLLLTGCRPSSAVVQLREDIDPLGDGFMEIQNVKTGKIKENLRYPFPIYKELQLLLNEIGFKRGQKGRLFPQFSFTEYSYVSGLTFWERAIKELIDEGRISQRYQMRLFRPTFASYAINVLKMSLSEVQRLLNHAKIEVTDRHYLKVDLLPAKDKLDKTQIIKGKEGKK